MGDEPVKAFFRRNAFAPLGYQTTPKWHRVASAINGVWTAKCGYRFEFLLEEPLERNAVKTRSLRCSKCDAAHEKESR